MSNIATGIGLSGKEKADLRGLEFLVGAQRDMAGQREAKRKSEEAAKQKLIDDVMKNTAFNKQFGNAYYQKEFERDAAERMARIIEPMTSGQTDYTNLAVAAYNEISALERANRQRKIEDESMSSMTEAFIKNPSGIWMADPKEVDGKTYNSPQQALNALAGDPDAGRKVAEAWGGANWYFGANEDEELGRMSFMFNPEMAVVTDPFEMARKSVTGKGEFTKAGTPRSMSLGRTTKNIQPYLPSDEVVNAAVLEAAATQGAQTYFMREGYMDFLKENPSGTFSQYMTQFGNPEEFLNSRFDEVKTYVSGIEGRREEISDTKPVPRTVAPTQSDFEKTFEVGSPQFVSVSPDGRSEKQYNVIRYSVRPGKTKQATPVTFGKGHVVIDSEGVVETPTSTQSREVQPYGPTVLDGKLFFAYTGKRGEDASTLYLNPFDQASFEGWKNDTGAPEEIIIDQVQTLAKGDEQVKKQVSEFLKKFGMSGLPVPANRVESQNTDVHEFDPLDY